MTRDCTGSCTRLSPRLTDPPPEDGWNDDNPQVFSEGNSSAGVPTLVEFRGTLYCFHRGAGSDPHLYYCTFDDTRNTWTGDMPIGDWPTTTTGVGATVYNNVLHLCFQSTKNNKLNHFWYDGTSFSKCYDQPSSSDDIPALVAYDGMLIVVYCGDRDGSLYHTFYNGQTGKWSDHDKLPHHFSKQGPALVVFDNKVYMVHRSKDNSANLYYAIYENGRWGTDTRFPDHLTGDNPALAVYMDPNSTPQNYENPSYAGSRLFVAYRCA